MHLNNKRECDDLVKLALIYFALVVKSLDFPSFESSCILALFVVGVNAEIYGDAFTLGSSFDHAADCRGGIALAPDEGGDVRLSENEAKVHLVFTRVADPQFCELGLFDELQGDILENGESL